MPRLTESDWTLVEKDYRAGLLSDRQIGEKYGVSHGSVQQQAKKRGWSRNLIGRSIAKAEEKLAREELATKLASETRVASEKELVDSTSDALVEVMRGHRSDASRLRRVVTALLEKVETIVKESELFEQIGDLCAAPDEKGIDKINDLYRKVIELPAQTDTTKKLAETMKILIELERKIFKIESGDDPVEAAARGAAQGAAQGVSEGSKSILAGLIAELNDAETSA